MPIHADRKWHPVPGIRRALSTEEQLQDCMATPKEFIPPLQTLLHALETLKTDTSIPATATGEMERAARTLDRTCELLGTMTQETLTGMHLSRTHQIEAIRGLAMLHASYDKVSRHLERSFRGLMLDINAQKASLPLDEQAACDRFIDACLTPVETIKDTMEKFNEKFRDLGVQPIARGR